MHVVCLGHIVRQLDISGSKRQSKGLYCLLPRVMIRSKDCTQQLQAVHVVCLRSHCYLYGVTLFCLVPRVLMLYILLGYIHVCVHFATLYCMASCS